MIWRRTGVIVDGIEFWPKRASFPASLMSFPSGRIMSHMECLAVNWDSIDARNNCFCELNVLSRESNVSSRQGKVVSRKVLFSFIAMFLIEHSSECSWETFIVTASLGSFAFRPWGHVILTYQFLPSQWRPSG